MAVVWTEPRVSGLRETVRRTSIGSKVWVTGHRTGRGLMHWRVARWLVSQGYAERHIATDRVGRIIGEYLTATDAGRGCLSGIEPEAMDAPVALVAQHVVFPDAFDAETAESWLLDRPPVPGDLIELGEYRLRVDYVLVPHGGEFGVRYPCGVTVLDPKTGVPVRKHDGHETATTITVEALP